MKKLLILALCLIAYNSKADSENCPTSVSYNSSKKQFTFYYAGGIPKDGNGNSNYDRIQIENSIGQGSQWYTKGGVKIKILSKTSTTLVTNNASDSLDGTSEMYTSGKHKDKITYWQGNVDLKHDYSSSDKRFINHCYYDAPLPVKLISFSYSKELFSFKWVTASEIDNEKFMIQESEDCTNWHTILEIQSKNSNSTSNTYYSCMYLHPSGFYRIVQRDFNGVMETFQPIYLYKDAPNISIIDDVITTGSLSTILNIVGDVVFEGIGSVRLIPGYYFILSEDKWFKIQIK
jgi:hypothetical protein